MAKTGRPTTYSQEIAEAICEDLATTDHSLQRICDQEGMPAPSTVYLWLTIHSDFSEQYTRARERQADFMAAQTVDIADDTSKDNGFAVSVAVARSRLRIDARKWLASSWRRRSTATRSTPHCRALMVGRSRLRTRLSNISGKRTKKTRFDQYMRQNWWSV